MDIINAIAKVRFNSAKPQRVSLVRNPTFQADLICMEGGQALAVEGGEWLYYVITGTASLVGNGPAMQTPTGQMASAVNEKHVITNPSNRRLVILALETIR